MAAERGTDLGPETSIYGEPAIEKVLAFVLVIQVSMIDGKMFTFPSETAIKNKMGALPRQV